MYRKIIICVAVFVVLQTGCYHQVFAQNKNNIVEITLLNIPDSIVFKIKDAANIDAGKVYVELVSGSKINKPAKLVAKPTIYRAGKGYSYTDKTVFTARGFDRNFKGTKIKFIVGDQNLFFDLAKSEWE